jgi:tetratricopeptide (TPR) repeat protein
MQIAFMITCIYRISLMLSLFVSFICKAQDSALSRYYNNLAVPLMRENPDQALPYLDSAIAADETNFTSYSNRANIWSSKGLYLNAIIDLKKGLKAKPALAEGHVFLGLLYDKTKQPTQAKRSYERALELFNDRLNNGVSTSANELNLAVVKILLEMPEGKEALNRWIKAHPDDINVALFKNFSKEIYVKNLFPK